jgi:hypothetical protein
MESVENSCRVYTPLPHALPVATKRKEPKEKRGNVLPLTPALDISRVKTLGCRAKRKREEPEHKEQKRRRPGAKPEKATRSPRVRASNRSVHYQYSFLNLF